MQKGMIYTANSAQKGIADLNITQDDVKLPQSEQDTREAYRKCETLLVPW